MRGTLVVATSLTACLLSACAGAVFLPRTAGEQASGFGYVPLDGLAVRETPDFTCPDSLPAGTTVPWTPLVQSLPDISVRFAVASAAADASLSFGPAKVTSAGGVYRAVLDYVNVDAIPVTFLVRKQVKKGDTIGYVKPLTPEDSTGRVIGYEAQIVEPYYSRELADSALKAAFASPDVDVLTFPVYVGIGMRLSADIRALKGGIALTSLGGIAAAAQANALSGTLTVQTLGVAGAGIATTLPLPSKLDQTTVENGILALGASRALIYGGGGGSDDVIRTPRIVGLYSPIGTDPRLINALYSALASKPQYWSRGCTTLEKAVKGTGSDGATP